MHGESSSNIYQKKFQRSTTSLESTGKSQTFKPVFFENVILQLLLSKIYGSMVVCDQIANKSFVLLNASILGEYSEKPSLRSASYAWRQDSVTGGGINKIFGGHKKFNTSYPRV